MKIYFITHSESEDNKAGISSGWKDVGLSELGVQQSKEILKRFKGIKIDLICSSDLKRAVDTVKIAFDDKYPIIADERLRELNYGDFNGKSSDMVGHMKKEKIKEPFVNGESYDGAMIRVHDFYNELKRDHSDKTIIVVGHIATRFGLETLINNIALKELLNIPFKWQPYWEYNW